MVVDDALAEDYEGDSVYWMQISYQENIEGGLIEFFVDGLKANQTAVWISGDVNELNLTAEGVVFLPLILR